MRKVAYFYHTSSNTHAYTSQLLTSHHMLSVTDNTDSEKYCAVYIRNSVYMCALNSHQQHFSGKNINDSFQFHTQFVILDKLL